MPRNRTNAKKLDNHLILHGWLNSHFGHKTTRELLNDVKNIDEGFNPDGHSPICEFLIPSAEPDSAIERELPTYDTNIKRHLSTINNTRTQPIALRYFQYLALLYTEIFLDWKFNRPGELLWQLNAFVQRRNEARAPQRPHGFKLHIHGSRETCLLDGNRCRQNPHHAHQLPPISPLL